MKNTDNIDAILRLSEEIHQNRIMSHIPTWMYFDSYTNKTVIRPLLFTDDKIYEEIKPGLYHICEDLEINTAVV